MAQLTFYGAVEGVTGSMYLLETDKSRVLLDCGLFQGRQEIEDANSRPFPFQVDQIDAVVLSHAHLDHSGRLPFLISEGYSREIIMTSATCDLIEVLLNDAASLQQRDAEWENKRNKRAGKPLITPLFTLHDVEKTLNHCRGVPYHQINRITEDVTIKFLDAGHILGSSIVEISVDEENKTKKMVFSGDLGNSQAALLKDPEVVNSADVLLLESTYGDREHRSISDTLEEFEEIIVSASQNGGNILIPSFAVGRTQEIIFRLGELYQQGKLNRQVVYLDSPMAIAVTEIYHRYQNVYNREDTNTMENGTRGGREAEKRFHDNSLHRFLPILRYTTSTAESIALNRLESGGIIIAGSGMCNGGRIRHHLKHNLWRSKSHVVFVGFQAEGTPGRALVDGAKVFKIGGERIAVKAEIHTMGGFSAHASQRQLIEWLSSLEPSKTRLYLVHGEENAKKALQVAVNERGWSAQIPSLGEVITF
ncbi:MBL fold metallo-hydrolase RNA specificity domain-containing protein [Aliikangiella sp. G2MR2-5]|uniref:MBL fold metallo-hydrolase RNA specificity domain-containing protein n=1 Tax=Aliikangiella sp. G2MR2-5 TaxID=2788943 RepID=UPI0018AA3ADF|nr:MBL fold metallo-hydrolase [Aliikangiella sp. G2MR2-5]